MAGGGAPGGRKSPLESHGCAIKGERHIILEKIIIDQTITEIILFNKNRRIDSWRAGVAFMSRRFVLLQTNWAEAYFLAFIAREVDRIVGSAGSTR